MDDRQKKLKQSFLRFSELGPEDFSAEEFLLLVDVFEQLSKWSQSKDMAIKHCDQCNDEEAAETSIRNDGE